MFEIRIMNKIRLFLRYELVYLLGLLVLIPVPLGFFFHFSEFKAPGLSYVLIGIIFLFQYLFYDQRAREKKLHDQVKRSLEKSLGKLPPHKLIHSHLITISSFRIISVIFVSMVILFISAFYKRLLLF